MDATVDEEWTVEFDDASGADRVEKHPGPITEGQLLTAYGRAWRIDRIDPDRLYAHAIPVGETLG
jgi:hypothetical protein